MMGGLSVTREQPKTNNDVTSKSEMRKKRRRRGLESVIDA